MQNPPNTHYNRNNATTAENKWSPANIARPEHLLQTPRSNTYSDAFNLSKRTGRNLWDLLTPVLPDAKNKELLQSIEIALYQWLLTNPTNNTTVIDDVPFINGLQFNEEYTLQKAMNVTVTAKRNNDNLIELLIPSINPVNNIKAPARTNSVTLKIITATYNIADGTKAGSHLTELNFPYKDAETAIQNIVLPVTAEQGVLTVLAMSIEYTIERESNLQMVHNLHWMPSGIIWAGYN